VQAGDLNGALRSLAEYQKLAPNDANPIDSAGEVQFYAGHFAEAAQRFMEANAKDKNLLGGAELYRAAVARLLGGDAKGADELWRSYAAEHKDEPIMPIRSAVWLYQSGHPDQALQQLSTYADQSATSKDLAALARSQIAILYMEAGDNVRAREQAAKALAAASAPLVRTVASLSAFVAQPATSAQDWQARAQKAVPSPQQARFRKQLLGYALMFNRMYRDAIPVWKDLYDSASVDQLTESRTMLAYCYLKSGDPGQAAQLIRLGVFPPRSPDPGPESIGLPHYIALRR
jgi:tetratricopeptide (TPR) repeat protein